MSEEMHTDKEICKKNWRPDGYCRQYTINEIIKLTKFLYCSLAYPLEALAAVNNRLGEIVYYQPLKITQEDGSISFFPVDRFEI